MKDAVSSSASWRRPATTTAPPSRPISSAIARPRPLPPPVTIATLPSKVPSGSIVASCEHDPGVEAEPAFGKDEQRVDLELGDLRMRSRDPGDGRGGPSGGRDVERGAPTNPVEEASAPERANEPLRLPLVDRGERDRDVRKNLGVEPAHAHERNRPEARVAARAHDELNPPLERRHPLD